MERKQFIKRLGELVNLQTLSGNIHENSKALDLVEKWADASLKKQRIKNGNAQILLLGNHNLLTPDFGYLVHMDVVAAQDEILFAMRESGGKLYGRGVSDMKFAIPIGLELLSALVKDHSQTSLTMAITTDEEVGGGDGGRYLASELGFHPQVLIVPDGGDNFVLVNKSKGVAHLQALAVGKTAHASRPWEGKNALHLLVGLAGKLLESYDQNSLKENWETTVNLGVIEGGKSTNQVCEQATMKMDFRFPETRSVPEVLIEVKNLARRIGPSMEISLLASGDPTYTDTKHPEIVRYLKTAEAVLKTQVKVKGECGASDARYWAKDQIPIIVTKPMGGGIHSSEEWVDVDSCLVFYEILLKYLSDFSKRT